MKRLPLWLLLVTALALVGGCRHATRSVFPPTVNIAQLDVLPNGHWRLRLRVLNNGYDSVTFHTMTLTLLIRHRPAASIKRNIQITIAPLSAEETRVDVSPSAAAAAALASIAHAGSAGTLGYTLKGQVAATPKKRNEARTYPVDSHNWLSPVPGIADRYR